MRTPRLIGLVLLALTLGVGSAAAQDYPRIQAEIDLTDRRIENAERIVSASDNEQARIELNEAMRIQGDAKTALSQSRPRIALDLTLRARQRADRAIALVNRLPDPDRVVAQIERTQDLLDRARERIEECDNDQARAMLQTAGEMQRRAQDAAKEGHYLGALQLTMGARERIHRALRMCRLDENVQESAERALRRTDELIQRAREQINDRSGEVARRELDRAVEIQGRAQAEYRSQHFEASIRLTLSARSFAFRALRRSGS